MLLIIFEKFIKKNNLNKKIVILNIAIIIIYLNYYLNNFIRLNC